MVKREQELAEIEREKEEEERRRKREAAKRRKRMLEAAFDGDNDEILQVLKEVDQEDTKMGIKNDDIGRTIRAKHQLEMVDCTDANNNTPLSEAGGGGHADTIKLLLEKGADPNSRGQFERTPLYRAAFSGHLEAAETLLQYGADPRIYANDGCTPEQIASVEALKIVLSEWDVSQTERLLEKIEKVKEQRKEDERKRREAEMEKLENKLKDAQMEHDTRQRELQKAYTELNKRITEHDKVVASGSDKSDITLQVVHDAEKDVEIARINAQQAQQKLEQIRVQIREQQSAGESQADIIGVGCNIKELDEVLMRDVGAKIATDGRWPLIIDTSGRAVTFLRYRDTNYLNALNPKHMDIDTLRKALLGALRYGKPAVLDMMEVDMFETVAMRMDEIHKGLMELIMNKEIMKNEKYLVLTRESDGDEYSKNKFNQARVDNFRFFIITKLKYPPNDLIEKTYPITVVVSVQ
ncbi:IQ motif and ankyrin repeat domain-containing protein 1-like [Saccoglossus kowalevskii]|uniref:IQ motif and ankyrin repeat domain-containing protein LOC642574-like n=1 Tax=Saccoglossus kowalevskii TaxID=10224 RepID=A0ABM0GKB6_SACKO|nr:PREDICTED: putative IQ motif and ankyrin repeat domain-containing protein LOC642574-like [Saccoglossus kowalevskii]